MKPLDKALMAAAGNVSTGVVTNPNAWDLDYADFERNSAKLYDISDITWVASGGAGIGSNPQGLFFKPDGTKMYVTGSSSDAVREFSLSKAWDPTTRSLTYTFSVSAQETTPAGLTFKADGTKMYVIGYTGDDINEYELSTAWDVSTASYSQNFSIAAQEATPRCVQFKTDGTKMYVMGNTGDDVNEYNLSTAWDVSTASYSQNFSVSAQETLPQGLWFAPDGETMWVMGSTGDDINEYTLSTAWDVSTASYSQNTSIAAYETLPAALYIKSDGKTLFLLGYSGDTVDVFEFGIKKLSVISQEGNTNSIFFKPDGTKMYVMGGAGDDINEYNLSTAWDVTTATYSQKSSIGAQETSPQGLYIDSSGTRVYVAGATGDDVNQYSLSTAWDISTLSYVRVFSVASQQTIPTGVEFKPDGTKMYVVGDQSDRVSEYDLSTAWDISTASFVQHYGVGTSSVVPSEVRFKPDGTRFFVLNQGGAAGADGISEYSLSTAWDISTSTYVKKFIVPHSETTPTALFFKNDGTKFYIAGRVMDSVWQYEIA
jgi:DNA-binding beta-propeller fold protein YncE